jgi:hypothetical protein
MPKERLLGVVLNRTEEQPDSNSYYYQHRYYTRERRGDIPAIASDSLEEEVAAVN